MQDPALTMGVEEEYLLVDKATRNVVAKPDPDLMRDLEKALGKQVTSEFLLSQVEVETGICKTAGEARGELAQLRAAVSQISAKYGYAPIAASTHPFALWAEQEHTHRERYDALARDIAGPARRLLICGMHVHIGIEDQELRIDLMNQVSYFLPHLLALSTSSPFWQGEDMGMMSYRLTVFDALPRTGIPDYFDSHLQYERMISRLVNAGIIEDATKLWWDIRPSAKFPTLEMRITDVCTNLDDCAAIAALYQCILSMLTRLRRQNQRWRLYPHTLVMENRWRAQRYGSTGALVDFGIGQQVPFADLIEELCDLVAEDADRLNCKAEIAHIAKILKRGTSAQKQREIFEKAAARGLNPRDAFVEVADFLIQETAAHLETSDRPSQSDRKQAEATSKG
jgi:carboxylate-amine ligase